MSTPSPAWLAAARTQFVTHFGAAPTRFAFAPGRVNLIGEHVDYHQGFVLPAAISQGIRALARPRPDTLVTLRSATFNATHTFDLAAPFAATSGWARRAEGIIRTVLADAPSPRGLDLFADADLPVGGGLSSSAASMAALGALAADLNDLPLAPTPFALTLQAAEHRFAGVNCGLMDQLAVLQGRANHALLIDCRDLSLRPVPIPPTWALVVLDSAIRHDLATSEYNRRQQECAAVLALLRARRPAVQSLRDATDADLDAVAPTADPVGLRRCRHVLAENRRVHEAVAALAAQDAPTVGRLFAASHVSLRDDYQVSCPELDALAEAAWQAPGCIGARMTGGGFGGSTVNLVQASEVRPFLTFVAREYKLQTGRDARVLVTRASDGLTRGEVP
jgi:galactokinase